MRRFIAMLALLAVTVVATAATARQSDERLDALFARLLVTSSTSEAGGIEATIWSIWTAAEDEAIDRMMAAGVGAMSSGRFASALESFNAIITADPDFAEGWNKRATLYYLMGRFEDSIADVEKTLALEPRHFGALSGLGLIYTALDDEKSALAWFEQALEVNPHMPSIALRAAILRKMLEGQAI